MFVRVLARFAIAMLIATPVSRPGVAAQDDIFKNRPAFSMPEQPAVAPAQCHEIRKMAEGLPRSDDRIDFSSEGPLTLVKSDGALWYLVMCSDVRVMCVTYEGNDMKAGDKVIFSGGYHRLDDNHALLDPCLANRP
jgi:hypothetical protein